MGGGGGFKGQRLAAALVNGRMFCECGRGKNHQARLPEGLVGLEGLSIFILGCWEPWNTVFMLCFWVVPMERFNSSLVSPKVRLWEHI